MNDILKSSTCIIYVQLWLHTNAIYVHTAARAYHCHVPKWSPANLHQCDIEGVKLRPGDLEPHQSHSNGIQLCVQAGKSCLRCCSGEVAINNSELCHTHCLHFNTGQQLMKGSVEIKVALRAAPTVGHSACNGRKGRCRYHYAQ